MPTISAFDAYQREWERRGEPLFFATMRAHPSAFRGRFPLLYDPSPFAEHTFTISDQGSQVPPMTPLLLIAWTGAIALAAVFAAIASIVVVAAVREIQRFIDHSRL